jgi:hypothetical protein
MLPPAASDPPLEPRRDERRVPVADFWRELFVLPTAALFWLGVCFAVLALLGAVADFWFVACAPGLAKASTLLSATTTIPIEPNLFMR